MSNFQQKYDGLKMTGAAGLGAGSAATPWWVEYMDQIDALSDIVIAITPLASFFGILIPTGIWAWRRVLRGEVKE